MFGLLVVFFLCNPVLRRGSARRAIQSHIKKAKIAFEDAFSGKLIRNYVRKERKNTTLRCHLTLLIYVSDTVPTRPYQTCLRLDLQACLRNHLQTILLTAVNPSFFLHVRHCVFYKMIPRPRTHTHTQKIANSLWYFCGSNIRRRQKIIIFLLSQMI